MATSLHCVRITLRETEFALRVNLKNKREYYFDTQKSDFYNKSFRSELKSDIEKNHQKMHKQSELRAVIILSKMKFREPRFQKKMVMMNTLQEKILFLKTN